MDTTAGLSLQGVVILSALERLYSMYSTKTVLEENTFAFRICWKNRSRQPAYNGGAEEEDILTVGLSRLMLRCLAISSAWVGFIQPGLYEQAALQVLHEQSFVGSPVLLNSATVTIVLPFVKL